MTRFKPSMAEIKPGGELVTPSVWDLHLHHVVWIAPDGGRRSPPARKDDRDTAPGLRARGRRGRHLGAQLHDPQPDRRRGRQVYVTWTIDWVPVESPSGAGIQPGKIEWLDVAGRPRIYPVFDAERGFDADGDGKYVFPDGSRTTRRRRASRSGARSARSRVDGSGRRSDPGVRRGSSPSRRAPRRPRGRPGRPRRRRGRRRPALGG